MPLKTVKTSQLLGPNTRWLASDSIDPISEIENAFAGNDVSE
jgi:hypothetical protein